MESKETSLQLQCIFSQTSFPSDMQKPRLRRFTHIPQLTRVLSYGLVPFSDRDLYSSTQGSLPCLCVVNRSNDSDLRGSNKLNIYLKLSSITMVTVF